ncbi:glutathione S-transferase theta-1-like [Ruditapes philippinarum]|uniref:glutathione S-transferase theta-1-like n=1 Tax=Ruditapes philippinarum TaxID=129788 RepID=UPI00295BFC57|nr:glutathione S-transferase theta-1-like [Ruditapes philippinarum]
MVVEFYYDLLSQPCRAVYIFFKVAGIPFEAKEIDLFKGEHLTPEFIKKNPNKKIPIIDDDGFILAESAAIMRYMALKNNVADHWFPRQDLRKQAKIDEFINWQHQSVRKPCVELFIAKFRSRIGVGRFTKQPADEAKLQSLREDITKSFSHIADYFLQDNQYLAGDEISLADIIGVCEIYHIQGVEEDALYTNNEKVSAWVARVRKRLEPDFDTASMKLMAVKQKYIDAKE